MCNNISYINVSKVTRDIKNTERFTCENMFLVSLETIKNYTSIKWWKNYLTLDEE